MASQKGFTHDPSSDDDVEPFTGRTHRIHTSTFHEAESLRLERGISRGSAIMPEVEPSDLPAMDSFVAVPAAAHFDMRRSGGLHMYNQPGAVGLNLANTAPLLPQKMAAPAPLDAPPVLSAAATARRSAVPQRQAGFISPARLAAAGSAVRRKAAPSEQSSTQPGTSQGPSPHTQVYGSMPFLPVATYSAGELYSVDALGPLPHAGMLHRPCVVLGMPEWADGCPSNILKRMDQLLEHVGVVGLGASYWSRRVKLTVPCDADSGGLVNVSLLRVNADTAGMNEQEVALATAGPCYVLEWRREGSAGAWQAQGVFGQVQAAFKKLTAEPSVSPSFAKDTTTILGQPLQLRAQIPSC